jgi:hypothetical protein
MLGKGTPICNYGSSVEFGLIDIFVLSANMRTRSGSLQERHSTSLVFETGEDTEPYWSSDGSAMWRHGLRPSLHPLYLPFVLDVLPSDCPQLSRDPPPSCGCLGTKENLSLCSLKEYPLETGRLLASGEPISKFGFDLGFVFNYFSYKVRRWLLGSRLPAIAIRWG